ncbi:MAG: septum formation family protein [Streptosporangiaceae bacterium]
MPGADQWYTPPAGPGRPRGRPAWLIPAGAAAAIVVIVVALVLALRPGSPKPPPGPGAGPATTPTQTQTHRASPTASATPTVGNLQLAQLQAGDCLTGADLNLNLNTPWPKLALAVPCNQGHTAEVFYANNYFWAKGGSYPGDDTIKSDATAECNSAFQSYVGIAYSQSQYTWTDIVPDASTWPGDDRGLHCVAYYSTTTDKSGVTIDASIEGTAK